MMQALLWRDYLCPWCYLGRDRTALIEALGVAVTPMSYELHPEVPLTGRAIRPGGRLDQVLDHIAEECEDVGLPMRKPTRTPNTRRALEMAEILRARFPDAFRAYDDACYGTHWHDGGDLGDPATLRALVLDAGADPDEVDDLLTSGFGAAALDRSMTAARELGVTATPAWWVDDRLLIPGAQPRATIERWITKVLERAGN
jgi:predicted DsbA family dithiol-disulfide isomerase